MAKDPSQVEEGKAEANDGGEEEDQEENQDRQGDAKSEEARR